MSAFPHLECLLTTHKSRPGFLPRRKLLGGKGQSRLFRCGALSGDLLSHLPFKQVKLNSGGDQTQAKCGQ